MSEHEGHDTWPLRSKPGMTWCRTCQEHFDVSPVADEREYRVVWVIELSGESHEDAARRAMLVQQNPESIAHVYEVTRLDRPDGITLHVDLDEIDGREI